MLPQEPGVYLFLNKDGKVLYVGKAKNLKKRVGSYFVHKSLLGEKTKLLVARIHAIRYVLVGSEVESLLLEARLIKKHLPLFNSRLTDGKSFPCIRITIADAIPKVLIARRQEDQRSLYFGPYPNVGSMRFVLRIVRRIFPFQSVLHHPKKYCLYHHLHLCPCPPLFKNNDERNLYKKQIRQLVMFLRGDSKKVIKNLTKERDTNSKAERFEEAKKIQEKMNAIMLITTPIRKPVDYEINPNLREDIRKKELEELKKTLDRFSVYTQYLERIECFDISNTMGTNATGSMVVFVNGEKDKASYRRFKIRADIHKPNDFLMMQEVLRRRLKHREWKMPNLIIVDGGKGQVSVASAVLKEVGINIPLIGLAKREETIITQAFGEIILEKSSPALQLMMRIRDEALRFAIRYHKKLRSRFTFE